MRFRSLAGFLALCLACSGSHAEPTGRSGPAGSPAPTTAFARRRPPAGNSAQVTPVTTLFVATDSAPRGDAGVAPWTLTASDGTGLVATRIDAEAAVEGPLAFTELHLYFHNPEARVREGTFSITLPPGAAVSRFAMENNGQMMEAEVVEKQLARRAYEDFLHRRQDPALLEKGEGNQFTARVFPIPANAAKHLVISFSQEVTPGRYTLPLRGLAKTDRVDVRVRVRDASGGRVEQALAERNWTPDRDVVVDARAVGTPMAIASGELSAARVRVELPQAAAKLPAVTILVDTSASRALGFAAQAKTVRRLIDDLARAHGGQLPVQVVAYDQTTAPIFEGRADQAGGVEQALIARRALGASDLGQALRYLAARAPKSRVVIVTDAVVTAGAGGDALPGLAKQLATKGVERIDVALIGGIRDDDAAARIARAGLPRTGAVLDLEQGTAEVARRIGLAVQTQIPIAADGARWVFPRVIDAAQTGDEVTVFVRQSAQAQQVALTIGERRTVVPLVGVAPALLDRAAAGAEIRELDAQLATLTGEAAGKLRGEIVRRSVAARVVSSQTSLLVLESDSDYARYGIDRSALADILTIGAGGVELTRRAAPVQQVATPRLVDAAKQKGRPSPAKPEKAAKKDAWSGPASPASATSDLRAVREAPEEEKDAVETITEGGSVGGALAGAVADAPPPPSREAERAEVRVSASGHRDRAASVSSDSRPPPATPPARTAAPPPPPAAPRPVAQEPAAPMLEMARRTDGRGGGNAVAAARAADDDFDSRRRVAALHGPLAEIERAIAAGQGREALAKAVAWQDKAPGDVLALIGYGSALEATQQLDAAARAYGSIIDLYPSRADFRRFAGERLERLGRTQRALIIDTYRRAVEQRPDHLTGHRLLAYALVRDGQYAAAFAAILAGLDHKYPNGRFAGADRVLAEDAGMIGAAYAAHIAGARGEVIAELGKRRLQLATAPSTRFIMYWETDANDVDFHIHDARGGHAYYSQKRLASGGELYADITTGYGPECFSIPGVPSAGPYRLSINYFSQGPMGYGMGLLQIQKFDGKGNLSFEDRPYVIMTNQAFVDLGSFR